MISIAIINNSAESQLYLGKLSKTSIEEFESLFELDKAVKGGYTLNVKIPVEGNEILMDETHAIQIRDDSSIFFVRIYDDGVSAFEASLVVEKSTVGFEDKFFDCNLIFQTFSVRSSGKMLKDVLTKEITFANSVEDVFSDISDFFINSEWPSAPANFPVTAIVNSSGDKIIANDFDISNGVMVNAGNEDNDFTNPTIPHPYYAEILRETFRAFGYEAKGPAFDDEFFTAQLMPNYKPMYDVHRPHEIILRTTTDQLIDSRMAIEWGELVWNSSSFTPTLPGSIIFEAYSGISPTLVSLKLKVKAIDEGGKVRIYRRAAGFSNPLYPENYEKEFFAVAGDTIEYSFNPKDFSSVSLEEIEINCGNDYEDWIGFPSDEVEPDYEETFVLAAGSEVTIYASSGDTLPDLSRYMRTSMLLGEMVPPLTSVADFLLAVKTAFQLKIDIDESDKTVHISRAVDVFDTTDVFKLSNDIDSYIKEIKQRKKFVLRWKNQTESLDDLIKLGSVASTEDLELGLPENSVTYVMAENAFYKSNGFAYDYHTIKNDNLEIGEEEEIEEIEIPIELIEMRSFFPTYEKGVLPTLKVESFENYNGVKEEDWNMMIMTHYGVAENKEGEFRPWATSASFDFRGNFLPHPGLPLANLEYSIFYHYHRKLINMLRAPVLVSIRVAQNYSLVKSSIKRKKILWRGNEFVEKRTLGYIGDAESTTEIEMIRL